MSTNESDCLRNLKNPSNKNYTRIKKVTFDLQRNELYEIAKSQIIDDNEILQLTSSNNKPTHLIRFQNETDEFNKLESACEDSMDFTNEINLPVSKLEIMNSIAFESSPLNLSSSIQNQIVENSHASQQMLSRDQDLKHSRDNHNNECFNAPNRILSRDQNFNHIGESSNVPHHIISGDLAANSYLECHAVESCNIPHISLSKDNCLNSQIEDDHYKILIDPQHSDSDSIDINKSFEKNLNEEMNASQHSCSVRINENSRIEHDNLKNKNASQQTDSNNLDAKSFINGDAMEMPNVSERSYLSPQNLSACIKKDPVESQIQHQNSYLNVSNELAPRNSEYSDVQLENLIIFSTPDKYLVDSNLSLDYSGPMNVILKDQNAEESQIEIVIDKVTSFSASPITDRSINFSVLKSMFDSGVNIQERKEKSEIGFNFPKIKDNPFLIRDKEGMNKS